MLSGGALAWFQIWHAGFEPRRAAQAKAGMRPAREYSRRVVVIRQSTVFLGEAPKESGPRDDSGPLVLVAEHGTEPASAVRTDEQCGGLEDTACDDPRSNTVQIRKRGTG